MAGLSNSTNSKMGTVLREQLNAQREPVGFSQLSNGVSRQVNCLLPKISNVCLSGGGRLIADQTKRLLYGAVAGDLEVCLSSSRKQTDSEFVCKQCPANE